MDWYVLTLLLFIFCFKRSHKWFLKAVFWIIYMGAISDKKKAWKELGEKAILLNLIIKLLIILPS